MDYDYRRKLVNLFIDGLIKDIRFCNRVISNSKNADEIHQNRSYKILCEKQFIVNKKLIIKDNFKV